MAVAELKLEYDQVLALVKQMPLADRKRLCDEMLAEPEEDSFSYWFNQVEPGLDITDEEILAECDIVREQLYHKYREAN